MRICGLARQEINGGYIGVPFNHKDDTIVLLSEEYTVYYYFLMSLFSELTFNAHFDLGSKRITYPKVDAESQKPPARILRSCDEICRPARTWPSLYWPSLHFCPECIQDEVDSLDALFFEHGHSYRILFSSSGSV